MAKKRIFLGFTFFFLYVLCELTAMPLRLAVPAMNSGLEKLQQWTAVTEYLEQQCDFEIELHIVKNHSLLEDGILKRQYDIGFVNALWERRLVQSGLVGARARALVKGAPSFTTSIIVHKDSVIRNMADIRGSYVAFTIPNESLGGFYVPVALFLKNGINPLQDFRQIIYADTYLSILKGVAFGVVDAGAVVSHYLTSEKYRQYTGELRVIFKSKEIPQWAMVARDDLKGEMIASFMEALIAMKNDSEAREILSSTGFDGFELIDSDMEGIPEEYLKMIGRIDAFSG